MPILPSPSSRARRSRPAHGSVLILTVWVISVLSILAAGLGARGAAELGLLDRLTQQVQAASIAAGATQYALQVLANDPSPASDGLSDVWANNEPLFANHPFGEGRFTIAVPASQEERLPGASPAVFGLVDEERKLNLNTAPAELLQRLLQIVGGLPDSDAAAVADAIEDWRDPDKEPREDGAEDFYYLGRDPPYEGKDGLFENLEELPLVRGMTAELFTQLVPYLTVYGSGRVNINTASPEVLWTLGLSEVGVFAIVAYRAGEDEVEGTSDDRALTATAAIPDELGGVVLAEDVNRLIQLEREGLLCVSSQAFSVSVTAEMATPQSRVALSAVVDREGHFTAWTER